MEKIHNRLRPYIPELWRNHKIVGLNERYGKTKMVAYPFD